MFTGKRRDVYVVVAAALLALALLHSACGKRTGRFPEFAPSAPALEELVPDEEHAYGAPPPVLELDELMTGAPKGVRNGAQVVSEGSDYSPENSDSTSDREYSIEVDDTSLNLRAYEPGDYTYALFAQQIGDGVWGGGQDDDIPLQSLIDTEVCAYGGGQDDDIPLVYFLGFADYSLGSWRWYGPFGTNDRAILLSTDTLQNRFKSPNDNFYIVVLTTNGGKSASCLPDEGLVAELPFEPAARAVAQDEDPGGVRINRIVTDADSGIGTAPGIVENLTADAGDTGVSLTWNPNPDPSVIMYHVYRREADADVPLAALADVDVPTTMYFDDTAVPGLTYLYGVRALNSAGVSGFAYAIAGYQSPPIVIHVTPTRGLEGATVEFRTSLFGSEPLDYSWEFGGGATPNTSTDEKPVVTLGEIGEYEGWVMVTNAHGLGSLDFTLTVLSGEPRWRTVTVASEGGVGYSSSLTVIEEFPAIAYNDDTEGALKFVRATDSWGSAWGSPVTADASSTGGSISLAIVNDHPAACYLTGSFNGALRYVRAINTTGDAWGSPVTIDECSDLTKGASLAIVNGNPAISYQGDSHLLYVRADDANGSTWGTPIVVDSVWLSGSDSSLKVVNGRPAISYYMGGLCYVRAEDSAGSTWGTPMGIISGSATGNWTSQGIVDGYPAISYYHSIKMEAPSEGALGFVRALDIDGSSWSPPQTIDDGGGGDVGQWGHLAIVNGNPAVSYLDDANDMLKYVRSQDAQGVNWGISEVVDDSGHIGGTTWLAEVNGSPAISYCDTYNHDLIYAVYY